jgi:hypothetical protein
MPSLKHKSHPPRPHSADRRKLSTLIPPVPVAAALAVVVDVTGAFGNNQTIWFFDRPVTIVPGGTFEAFTIREDGGPLIHFGASALQLTPQTVRITLSGPPADMGNGWFWEISRSPTSIRSTEGGAVKPEYGDLSGL